MLILTRRTGESLRIGAEIGALTQEPDTAALSRSSAA